MEMEKKQPPSRGTRSSTKRQKEADAAKLLLKAAAAQAVQFLIDTMENEEVKPELRKACAEMILDRVYGKATQPIDGEVDSRVELVLGKDLERYAD